MSKSWQQRIKKALLIAVIFFGWCITERMLIDHCPMDTRFWVRTTIGALLWGAVLGLWNNSSQAPEGVTTETYAEKQAKKQAKQQ